MTIKRANKLVSKVGDPFHVGLALTTLYVGAVTYEILVAGISGNVIEDNGLNSLGDFLAGVFAPIAFLWLVVTVFLQKQELALTRKEMEEQRKAMRDQADEAKANTLFVEMQTTIMKEQTEHAKSVYMKTSRLQMFDKRMEVYNEIKKISDMSVDELSDMNAYFDIEHTLNKARYVFGEDDQINRWILRLQDAVYQLTNGEVERSDVMGQIMVITHPASMNEMFESYLLLRD
ncbi:hypothetical protein CFBP6625_06320 [Agrobacterium tumefaciens]|nr:hypothetical protein CFBP6625_06320 [Agrobacterium tumefaciens]